MIPISSFATKFPHDPLLSICAGRIFFFQLFCLVRLHALSDTVYPLVQMYSATHSRILSLRGLAECYQNTLEVMYSLCF